MQEDRIARINGDGGGLEFRDVGWGVLVLMCYGVSVLGFVLRKKGKFMFV